MTSKSFEVPNVHCMGCVQAIKNELRELDGVASVNGDARSRMIEVEFEAPATWDAIVAALTEIEYPPAAS
ncbi:MAG: heavy-metal-associated domain-containing protein [Chloroflexota bacterium]|nr:heavy-metal-associated domain-containing protein [Chloroflexota bacterium]MDE2853877.1 heavy-metal-associated domain-containing protein [Chloroflexota bacterium]MDE2946627.1 heavy-metal-associated domain-containing protein [Chloroflexota bacterium]